MYKKQSNRFPWRSVAEERGPGVWRPALLLEVTLPDTFPGTMMLGLRVATVYCLLGSCEWVN